MKPPSRGPGRPKSDEPSISVSTWLKSSEHQRIVQLAHQRHESVSSVLRDILSLKTHKP